MKDGFIKTAAVVPEVRVADPAWNADQIIIGMKEAESKGAKIIAFPELAVTGYTCHDLFLMDTLLQASNEALMRIVAATHGSDAIVLVGFPLAWKGALYNTAAVIQGGRLLAFIPKVAMPNYGEFYELRQFTPGPVVPEMIQWHSENVPFGSNIILQPSSIYGCGIACEICEDAWIPDAPDIRHALAGATMVFNLSASNETVGKDKYRTDLIKSISARTITCYTYVSSGDGESTQDIVFGGRVLMVENGEVLSQRRIFDQNFGAMKMCFADYDIAHVSYERRRMSTFASQANSDYLYLPAHMDVVETKLDRKYPPHPFVPDDKLTRDERCEDILNIQARGLAKRLKHTHASHVSIGISGGLDSTLALLVTARAFDLVGLPREQILTVTMPCFGTTDRTYNNACKLAGILGTTLKEVDIKDSVNQHFKDIGHDPSVHDVTYENCQARERTQVLMDIANQAGGFVIGTGDLSELALGWATYNGDHMSMYGVNASVPKTLVSHLVRYTAMKTDKEELRTILLDILDTPVSPELLPPTEGGKIAQKTEDLVGPYELHDFFLYYMLRQGFPPEKIFRLALMTFEGVYDRETILKWLKKFYWRFFAQQFKRSCLPDGPKVGSVAVSPRGDLRMPSDAVASAWIARLENLS
ncbi:MAG: NAD(+) synthase [Lachnospiraceae bacterium]|nr:NAD(+) synthase [Lachnospiraceae bacterium]